MSPVRTYRDMAPGMKNIVRLGALAIVGLIALGVVSLTMVLAVNGKADDAGSKAQIGIELAKALEAQNTDVFCPIWLQGVQASKSFAPGQKISESGLKLYVLFWNAYDRQACASALGPLPKPDPQLAPLLPVHLR